MSHSWSQGLLEPISAESPCGDNLEDTQQLAFFDGFRVFGRPSSLAPESDPEEARKRQATPPDPPPDWSVVKKRATAELAKSKDLRLLAHLGSAVLWTEGLPAFAETLMVASQWLESWWSEVYPLVTEDAILRRSALNCFADQRAIIDALRRLPLAASREHGDITLRDVDIVEGRQRPDPSERRVDERTLVAAFAAVPADDLRQLHKIVVDANDALTNIESRMRTAAGPDAAPDFDRLSGELVKAGRVIGKQLESRPEPKATDGVDTAPASAASTVVVATAVGSIQSRQDAIRALDAVADFFRHNEPSSPIPLFVERAKRLVSKNFLEVLADIAPDAVPQARVAGGVKEGE